MARGYASSPGMNNDIELAKDGLKCKLAANGSPRENSIPGPETKKT